MLVSINGTTRKISEYKNRLDQISTLALVKPIDEDLLTELKEEVFQNPHITPNKKHSALKKSAAVVKAISNKGGLSTILAKSQIEQIVARMSSDKFNPLPAAAIREVLYKKFEPEERIDLYERLSNLLSPLYGGDGVKISLDQLAHAARVSPGLSAIVLVWLRPPRLKEAKPSAPAVPPDLEALMEAVKEFTDSPIVPVAVNHLKALKAHHESLLQKYDGVRPFGVWLRSFLESAYYNNGDRLLHPACLKLDSREFLDWNREFARKAEPKMDERQRERQRMERQRTAKQEEEGRFADWCDALGLDPEDAANRQAYQIQ